MAITDNLIAGYKLSDTSDYVGSYNLTNTGSCTFGAGLIGNCVTFPAGSNHFLGRTDTLGITATGSFSISMWVKMASETVNDRELFQLYFSSASGALYRGLYEYNSGNRRVRFFRIGSGATFVDKTGNIANNAWHHIVYTYNGSTESLYVDNGTAVTGTNTGNTDAGATLCNLGGGTSNSSLDGSMDLVYLWSRAITSTEVATLYNSGSGYEISGGTPAVNSNFFALF